MISCCTSLEFGDNLEEDTENIPKKSEEIWPSTFQNAQRETFSTAPLDTLKAAVFDSRLFNDTLFVGRRKITADDVNAIHAVGMGSVVRVFSYGRFLL